MLHLLRGLINPMFGTQQATVVTLRRLTQFVCTFIRLNNLRFSRFCVILVVYFMVGSALDSKLEVVSILSCTYLVIFVVVFVAVVLIQRK